MAKVFDNGGTTFDRYTVVIGNDIYGCSEHPFHPQGFGQYCGSGSEYNHYINGDGREEDTLLTEDQIPEDVKKFIETISQ